MNYLKWITPEIASAGTLRWINRIRIAHKLEPMYDLPTGNRYDPRGCVIANSIWEECSVTQYGMKLGGKLFKLPVCALAFIYHFDSGKLPELVKRSQEQLEELEPRELSDALESSESVNVAVNKVLAKLDSHSYKLPA